MSAAHELVERGFDVEVYEKQYIPGGKARSIPVFEELDDRGSQGVHVRSIEKFRRMKGHELALHRKAPLVTWRARLSLLPRFLQTHCGYHGSNPIRKWESF